MQSNKAIKLRRLQKEEQQLINDPIANVLVKREGILNFHFVIYNLDGEYKGGFYHGLLELHENYPFAAPKLFFFTPSGRFQINLPICTSFTNYHQQSWTSAWNVRSLLLGTVSFMTSNEASYGCRSDSLQVKMQLAAKSLSFNMKNPKFRDLFLDQLQKLKIPIQSWNPRDEEKVEEKSQSIIENEIQVQVQLQNDPELLLPHRQRQRKHNNQNQNQNRRWKKLAICIAIPTAIFVCYLILR